MTYQDAVAYLESFANYERMHAPAAMRQVKLERMQQLCRRLGDPHRSFRSVLVAGTNGKGSICALLYAMLRESPLRVGLYTSPHVEHLRERIRVWTAGPSDAEHAHAGDWISESEFVEMMAILQPVLEAMRNTSSEATPTYFEVITALAFLFFQRRHVELAILEVGLGGRLDATNIVDQAISIITPIDLDHTEILGHDPVTIAHEKAGIIMPGQTVITAPQRDDVMEILRMTCETQGVPLLTCDADFSVSIQHHTLEGLQVSIAGLRGIYESVTIPLIGRHQAQNAAMAVAALEALSPLGVPYTLVEQGLAKVEWPGRIEVVNEAPLVIMDGAHNPQAAKALAQTLTELCQGRTIHMVVGMSADKDVEAFGQLVGKLAVSLTCTTSRHPRALEPTQLATRLFPFCNDVHVMSDPVDAYTYVLNAVAARDVIVVTGSFFLVGCLRAAIRHAHIKPKRTAQLEAAAT